jgi:hypothetical protein
MCEFISWIEKEGDKGKKHVLFLTNADLDTRKGKKLDNRDKTGHGAIREVLGLSASCGQQRECVDFSKPSNFPAEIVKAIKRGVLSKIGTPSDAEQLLNKKAIALYITGAAEPMLTTKELVPVFGSKKTREILEKLEWIRKNKEARYRPIRSGGRAGCGELCTFTWSETLEDSSYWPEINNKLEKAKVVKPAKNVFWELFKDKKNRKPCWR